MYYEIDVDDKKYLYQMLIYYTFMLRIGCQPMILITFNLAKTWLNMIKVNCYRLLNHLPLEVLECLEVSPLGHVGSVLLSVVAQALLCDFLCAGFLLLPLPTMPLMASSGKYRLLRVGLRTETHHRCTVGEEGFHL
jgi:hypothetical protein